MMGAFGRTPTIDMVAVQGDVLVSRYLTKFGWNALQRSISDAQAVNEDNITCQ